MTIAQTEEGSNSTENNTKVVAKTLHKEVKKMYLKGIFFNFKFLLLHFTQYLVIIVR